MSRSVGDLGEFVLIGQLTTRLSQGSEIILGPGDDAAVVSASDGRVVATTDLLIENRHFRREWSGPYDIGRKAAAQNLADIAAMGARPTALLVGLAVPAQLSVDWVLAFVDGLRDECRLVDASVAGGDLSAAADITLGITALGDLAGRPPVTRAGARPGDQVVLAGRVGWAAAGLALLHAGVDPDQPPREVAALVAAHRRPAPPYALGPELAAAGATAMCDVSDGLVQDLGHIAAASGVRLDLSRAALEVPPPLAEAARVLAADPWRWLLSGGDDHALAACLPAAATAPAGCRVIGRVAAGEGVRVDGEPWAGAGGHDHFAPPHPRS